jgi:hypothetical protein
MQRIRFSVAVFAVLLSSFAGRARATQVPPTIDYDTFMQQDDQGRIKTFNQVTPENRAELVQTQIKRWVEKNRGRLTAEQLRIMDENLAFVTADIYRLPKNQENMAKAKDLETRTAAVFSREDMMQALTIRGDYIPKKS